MEPESSKNSPLGILLIATFWIFVGVLVLSMIPQFYGVSSFIFVILGIFFIFVGWGLIILKTWAWIAALILSIIGLLPMVGFLPYFFYGLGGGLSSMICFPVFLMFLPMIWYLLRTQKAFFKNQNKKPEGVCYICGRFIPSDARICPYCGKELDELAANENLKK
jgi:hypothetical protein